MIEARAEFKTEFARDLPAIGGISLVLIEAKESDGVIVGFVVGAKVAQQRIGKSVSRRLAAVRVEGEVARVPGSTVLVFTIADDQPSHL